jgi:tagatose 1,6-diphosphate aldolase GatY/KbaY
MLARGTGILAKAIADHTAVPAFATYNLEMVQAVVAAAEQTGRPVIMLAGSSHFSHAGRTTLVSIALQAAHDSTATIGVHLDHCRALAEIELCVKAGYSSVMVDGSHLPFEDNIELTRAAVALAHPAGTWVEAELGAVPGDEDVSTGAAPAQTMTDPREAAEFVERTGVDALAVAVGDVHGLTTTPVPLDLDRLAAIKAAVPVPLVLHGASGLPDQQLGEAIRRGVAKININTELRQAYLAAVQSALPAVLSTHDSVALWRAGREAVTTAAVRSIHALSATSWATLSEPDVGPDPAANRAATSPDRHLRR